MPFERLFSPLRLGGTEIRSRIAVTGLGWNWGGAGERETLPGPELATFWSTRAANGVGLIVSEPQSVHPTSTATPQVIENTDDRVIEPYRLITDAVHAQGGTIVAQLNHAGHLSASGYRNRPLWAPSEIRAPAGMVVPAGGGTIPHAMTAEDIAELIAAFASAAERAIRAGFDGVEVNAAENYLLAQFLSRYTNRRTDEYGGDGRGRLVAEVIAAVRASIGDPLLGVRIGTDDHLEAVLTVDDVARLAKDIGARGGVDYLSTTPGFIPHMGYAPGAFSELARAAKQASGLPVLYLGWADGPHTAEDLLAAGDCDMVGMTRALLADPELPVKARAGALPAIRPCIACNQICTTSGTLCVVRPRALPLAGTRPSPSDRRERWLVIGGGPAGVEAAAQLARRGHAVTLWERGEEVGGQLRLAARAPHRERLGVLADYLEWALADAGVEVELGRNATAADVRAFGADAIVVATGARSHRAAVPGADQPQVADVRSVLEGNADLGERVLVVIGRSDHRYQGLTAAEFIAAQGSRVQVTFNSHLAGDQWEARSRLDTHRRLARLGVTITPLLELVAIREQQVEMRNVYSGEPVFFEADTVVVAHGDDANSELLAELEALPVPVYSIGDVSAPRDLEAAFRDAVRMAARTDAGTRASEGPRRVAPVATNQLGLGGTTAESR